ncbi:VWA domain-containing protein [Mycolicibacterium sp. 018/SC-01/001]|uniref:vWA domain-containing protein n=1 Tax=Mycolicibacterium sp. 018/SC-01/001 TaxID=2592069 RepID=UPI00117CBFE9|nr:vWA domain-containing protein [Mycolicibacterium sp. 018/SC-01/001]TRW86196.1 VWA domain-containing protein [Mycolicibacterium sp. 018/SC-01/001]
MPNQNLTLIAFLLDRSGSMQSIKSDVVGGFDAFLAEQRAGDGDCRVTLAQFDDGYEVVYRALPVGDVPPLVLNPRNTTALLDSMGKLITDTAAEIAAFAKDDKPGSVIIAIMTDGLENASQEWSRPAIKALVEQQTNEFGWEFLYMGADQDAVEVGKDLGVKAEQAATYSRGKSREAMAAMSVNVRGYRNARLLDEAAPMPAFSEDQRSELGDD